MNNVSPSSVSTSEFTTEDTFQQDPNVNSDMDSLEKKVELDRLANNENEEFKADLPTGAYVDL
jgi:hypothetical protein